MPEMKLSFEPIELTSKILSQGSPTPVEVQLISKDRKQNEEYAHKIIDQLRKVNYLRDLQIDQSTNYPGINVNIDRIRAAQLGVGLTDISRSLIPVTSSSRYTDKNIWLDEKANLGYNVQVQVPVYEVKSIEDLKQISVLPNSQRPILGDLASISHVSSLGEADDVGAIPTLSVTANLHKMDLGRSSEDVQKAIDALGKLPKGLTIQKKGLSVLLAETLGSLQSGLLVAIAVIFLMLAANFQSFKVAFVVLFGVPAVLLGAILFLIFTGSTLNLQSYMGIIMSVGVSISNSVLLIIQAETHRKVSQDSEKSATDAVFVRLRPIIMTSLAMIVGMIPMAAGIGEGGDQTSPLGRAVIGGLLASTFATIFILPLVFAWVQDKTSVASVSLDPEDPYSKFFLKTPLGEETEGLNSSPYIHDV
jgi:multidrug efflux pump subunit AcrB